MVEFSEILSPVQTVEQRATPSAAPLIAQVAGGLLQAGVEVRDTLVVKDFAQDVQEANIGVTEAQASIIAETQPLSDDPVDDNSLQGLAKEAARRTLAVEQGVMSKQAAEASIGALFKTFAAENPHLTSRARQVIGGLGVSLGSGLGSSASTRVSPEEKQARAQALAIRSIQDTVGGTLEQAGKVFVELQQADLRSKMEPTNAAEFTTTSNAAVFNKVATITTNIINAANVAVSTGDFASLDQVRLQSLGAIEQARVASKSAVNQWAQTMAKTDKFLSQGTLTSQLNVIDAQYDDLKSMAEGDLTDASKIMKDNAAFVANKGLSTYNKLFQQTVEIFQLQGKDVLAVRAQQFIAGTPEVRTRYMNAFAAAEPVLEQMVKGKTTLREALSNLGVVGEQRSEIARAVDFLQDAGEDDIWGLLMKNTARQAEVPNPGGGDDADDVNNSATAAALAGTDLILLTIPHVTASIANPQGYMLSGSFFNKYRSSLEAGQAEKLAQIGDRFASASLTSISSNMEKVNRTAAATGVGAGDVLEINTEVVSPTGAITVPIPTQPTTNRAISSIPFIKYEISTAPEFNESFGSGGVASSRSSISDNVKRMNYLLTFLYASGSPEFKGILERTQNQFKVTAKE